MGLRRRYYRGATMTTKCCETCYKTDCRIEWACTRSKENTAIENKDVSPCDVGLHEPADFWNEGTSIENIMYRIREIEKELEGV